MLLHVSGHSHVYTPSPPDGLSVVVEGVLDLPSDIFLDIASFPSRRPKSVVDILSSCLYGTLGRGRRFAVEWLSRLDKLRFG